VVGCTENRRVRTDSDTERQYSYERESGPPSKLTKRVNHIALDLSVVFLSSYVPLPSPVALETRPPGLLEIAEQTQRLLSGFRRAQTLPFELRDASVQMELEFLVHLVLDLPRVASP
jgi:hypothetical protein